jgi:CheY-like chemotaxis protein
MPSGARARLLVADGDDERRAWLRSTLDGAGWHISEASCGFELLDRLAEEGPYDLVITDLLMPEARRPHPTGLQVAAMVREAGLRTPFLVLADAPDARLVELLRAFGRALLLSAPFDRHALIAAVKHLLSPRTFSTAP